MRVYIGMLALLGAICGACSNQAAVLGETRQASQSTDAGAFYCSGECTGCAISTTTDGGELCLRSIDDPGSCPCQCEGDAGGDAGEATEAGAIDAAVVDGAALADTSVPAQPEDAGSTVTDAVAAPTVTDATAAPTVVDVAAAAELAVAMASYRSFDKAVPGDAEYQKCIEHLGKEAIGKIGKAGKQLKDYLTTMGCFEAKTTADLAKQCMSLVCTIAPVPPCKLLKAGKLLDACLAVGVTELAKCIVPSTMDYLINGWPLDCMKKATIQSCRLCCRQFGDDPDKADTCNKGCETKKNIFDE